MDSDDDGKSFVEGNLLLMKERLARRLEKKRRRLKEGDDLEPLLAPLDGHLLGEPVGDGAGDPPGDGAGDPPGDGAGDPGGPPLDQQVSDVETLAERVK